MRTGILSAALATALLIAGTASAQFKARVVINDRAITQFEIDQRALFLAALRTPGDLEKLAIDALIEDRLAEGAAKSAGISVAPDEVAQGIEEFAARFNITPDQLADELGQQGVEPETVRDFVASGLAWRQVVQQRFQGQAFVSEDEIDAALATGSGGGLSVLVAEIVLPLTPGFENQTIQLAEDLSRSIRSNKDFEESALAYSASASRQNGGQLDWLPLTQFPPTIAPMILALAPGQVTPPVQLPGAIGLFQMRGLREAGAATGRANALDYVIIGLPGGRTPENVAAATRLVEASDTCHDLQTHAQGVKGSTFIRETRVSARVPRDIARELSALDPGEASTALAGGTNGSQLLVVMLCGRTRELPEGEREQFRVALFNQRVEALGRGFMDELKADAVIVRK